jgi:hypothetical protein
MLESGEMGMLIINNLINRYMTHNLFNKEPEFYCPVCNTELFTDWVDNGFGRFAVQASPYVCECGWNERGCETCIKDKCFSWEKCQGRAVIKPTTV